MIRPKKYLEAVLETDLSEDILFHPAEASTPAIDGLDVTFSLAMARKKPLSGLMYFDQDEPDGELFVRLRFYAGAVLRMSVSPRPQPFAEESPMLAWDPSLQARQAVLQEEADGWSASDGEKAFFRLRPGYFAPQLSPDGATHLAFQGEDQFFPHLRDALPLLRLERGDGRFLTGISLKIHPGEHFCGTGERFERPDLFGQRIDLANFDAAGVNNDRAYKNVPFLLSSRGYGIFAHSSAKMRLDIGAHSTRSLQWLVQDELLDVFFIGGSPSDIDCGSPADVLWNYQRITGFPNLPPAWSFGTWMSRSTYFSDAEASQVARRLRAEGYPADVIHLDTGWFAKDWVCDWTFSPETFPDPAGFMQRMAGRGFRVSLWQSPYVHPETKLAREALERGYVGKETDPSSRHWLGYTLDFTHPEAAIWYTSLLEPLLRQGAAVIKTDFGEEVDETAVYAGMSGEKYHNLFALLYQKEAWEITRKVHGKENALIWARSAWAGSQRYPVHWGGDAASTYDGLAGTLMGGLHFGLSGFAFWSHDVGGIHGIPDYMHSPPSDDIYVRWTQVGVFSSHLRFHGSTPREPWAFPEVAEIVRQWLRLRYALLPYILSEAGKCCRSGLPMLRSLVFDWRDDPTVWSLSDEYLFGSAFLVCPVLDASGKRDVYLPSGEWVDFWSGETLSGPRLIQDILSPLTRLPLYVRPGRRVEFAEPVHHTGELPKARRFTVAFDETYPGFEGSELGKYIQLDPLGTRRD
jgi:alpha-D-xyloside xylohydrolase